MLFGVAMALTVEKVLEGLTEPQRVAAMHTEGPLLVLAGAGSGKTRTITRRVAYMVAVGLVPENILAITFTNKAAGEMRERIGSLLAGAAAVGSPFGRRRGVTVATFHALCAKLLREYADAAGLPKTFTIFDSGDQTKLVKQAIKDVGLSADNFAPAQVHGTISNAKNKLQTAAAFTQAAGAFYEKNVARIYAKYEALLKENKGVDFDDLLLKMAILLRDNTQTRTELQERYQYILIDEYQDTNHAQFVIAHMLAMNHKNICATGDPDQSIYGWRGANLNNILEFEQNYPNAKVVLLEQNYRSTKTILRAASALIATNTKRKKKDLWTDNEQGPKITKLCTGDEHQEATEIVRRIKEQHDKEKLPWGDMAIFYRVNSLSRVLEDALMKGGVPYQIARGTEFYARKEIKDVIAYLRVIANPEDNVSLERIVNVPPRALGDTTVTRMQAAAADHGASLLEALATADKIEGVTPRAANSARKLAGQFAAWRKFVSPEAATEVQNAEGGMQNGEVSAADMFANSEEAADDSAAEEPGERPAFVIPGGIKGLIEKVIRESGLEEELKKKQDESKENNPIDNVYELVSVAAEFDAVNPGATLDNFIEQVTLASDTDKLQDTGGAVTLMTLHAAKGLEFPFVAMVGMEDGLIPHARAISFTTNPDDLEEERRLAFVGITRAMKQLVLSHARYRMVRGETIRTVESQFFSEMPEEVFEEVDLTAGDDDEPGSLGYRDEAGYRRDAEKRRGGGMFGNRADEAREQRAQAAKLGGEFKIGMLVRHPQFGLGRIESITAAGPDTRVEVRFQGVGTKRLIMQYARLERVDT
jgi:DNA helicase II / ATP-dependent DNA helicase PcrA